MGTLAPNLMKHLVEEHGKNISAWPEELRDLLDPTIEPIAVSAPMSGKVEKFLNTDFHYHWVEFEDGAKPKHDRAMSLRYVGWDFASTDDVKMCAESTVMGRNKNKKSRDGGDGWTDDIRSGDRRLMKVPMRLWKQNRKAQVLSAYQMAYPQPYSATGQPMRATDFVPGLKTEILTDAQIAEAQGKFNPTNSVAAKTHKQIEEENKRRMQNG